MADPTAGAPSRARHPDATGQITRAGVRVVYDVYGAGEPTVLLLPTWSIVHSRVWKMQIPYLARHYRVVTFDGRGNGRSGRPRRITAYADTEFVDDAVAVLDATGTPRACIIGLSMGGGYALRLAAEHPDRVMAAVFEGPAMPLGPPNPERAEHPVDRPLDRYSGWAKYNYHYWREDYADFLEFFFSRCFSEPHSTKPIEDTIGWGLQTDAATLIRTNRAPYLDEVRDAPQLPKVDPGAATRALARRIRCPTLVIHGTADQVSPYRRGADLADLLGAEMVAFEGSGHIPSVRDPVRFNLVVRDFIDRVQLRETRTGAADVRPQA